MSQDKETLKIVVVGHVDHGKSTLIGRLLYDTKSVPEGAINKVKRICKDKGKFFEYAYLLDAFEEEQKQGITIDTTQIQFFTRKRDYIIIDAPGHKEFLKNMISGAANAEAALLLVDAQEGIQEQSKRHGYILSLLGIRQVYVVVNKMDLIDYSQEKFEQIKREFNLFLNGLNIYPAKYIPVSSFFGENITAKSAKMPWYQEEPILEALDLFEKEKGLADRPLRFPIQDVYKFDERRIIAGRIETGRLKVGDKILISPGNKTTTVKSIEYWAERDKRDTVEAGMSIGITVTDEFFNQRGQIISHMAESPQSAKLVKANLVWMGRTDLVKHKRYKLKLATQEIESEIYAINKVIDASSLETITDAQRVRTNDVAEVVIKTKQALCFDNFATNQTTGRFVLVDGYDVCGGGIIAGALAESDINTTDRQITIDKLVSRTDRENREGQSGKVIWITGGQQVNLAVQLEKALFDQGLRAYYLETQALEGINFYSDAEEVKYIAEIAKVLLDTGLITIVTPTVEDSSIAETMFSQDDLVCLKATDSENVKNQLDSLVAKLTANK
ncbi:MAG TPA: GTP-binding protein [Desulfobacteria bacterium]|nr:GTP-binding protein [Desulfobacteria bacterium]